MNLQEKLQQPLLCVACGITVRRSDLPGGQVKTNQNGWMQGRKWKVSFLLQSVWNANDFDRMYLHANVHSLGEYERQHWVIRWSFMVFQGHRVFKWLLGAVHLLCDSFGASDRPPLVINCDKLARPPTPLENSTYCWIIAKSKQKNSRNWIYPLNHHYTMNFV